MYKSRVIFSALFFILFIFASIQSPNGNNLAVDSTDNLDSNNAIITIASVGDIMMGSSFPLTILPPNNGQDLFSLVKNELINCDLTIGNLEAPLCDSGKPTKDTSNKRNYIFRTPSGYAKNLTDAGFDVVNLANNHIGDFGKDGINSTKKALNQAGIQYTGLIGDIAQLKIKQKKVVVIGFSPHYGTFNLLNIRTAQKIIADLNQKVDIVIVTFHGGREGNKALHTKDTTEYLYDDPRGNVVEFSHAVIDSGADMVIGHGPHVPRALEIYQGKLIAYSLGNFCTYGQLRIKGENGLSLILKVELDTLGNFVGGQIISLYQQAPGIPTLDSLGRTIKLINRLSQHDFPMSAPEINSEGIIFPKKIVSQFSHSQ